MDYFSANKKEIYLYDTFKKEDFQIFESLRYYIERVINKIFLFFMLIFYKKAKKKFFVLYIIYLYFIELPYIFFFFYY